MKTIEVEYIQLKSKKHFVEVMGQYGVNHKSWIWDTFKENTCYIPKENCFISLDRVNLIK